MTTKQNPHLASRDTILAEIAATRGMSLEAVQAAYTTPQPAEHQRVHNLVVWTGMPPNPQKPAPRVPVVCPRGELYVVLSHLAWELNFEQPREAELEAAARAWAATLPAHHRALADLWVNGFPLGQVPCLRWPLLRAFLHAWLPAAPGNGQRQLMEALAQDAEQVPPENTGNAPEGRPPKIDENTVHQLYRLRQEGKSRMEAATALNIGVSTCKEIAAGRYPFATVTARVAWEKTFGREKTRG